VISVGNEHNDEQGEVDRIIIIHITFNLLKQRP
jgi:hypothetical protein